MHEEWRSPVSGESRRCFLKQVSHGATLCLAASLGGCVAWGHGKAGSAASRTRRVSESGDGAKSRTRQRQYLIFAIQNMPLGKAREVLAEIKDFYGPNDPQSAHLYGFSLWSLMLFKQSPEEMRSILNQAFDLAEESDLPVYLHLDMLHNPPTPDKFQGPDIKMGYDRARLETEAASRGLTMQALFTELCHQAGHGYTQLLAKTGYDSGLPPERLDREALRPPRADAGAHAAAVSRAGTGRAAPRGDGAQHRCSATGARSVGPTRPRKGPTGSSFSVTARSSRKSPKIRPVSRS